MSTFSVYPALNQLEFKKKRLVVSVNHSPLSRGWGNNVSKGNMFYYLKTNAAWNGLVPLKVSSDKRVDVGATSITATI